MHDFFNIKTFFILILIFTCKLILINGQEQNKNSGSCTVTESSSSWIQGLVATCNGYNRIPKDIPNPSKITNLDMGYGNSGNILEVLLSGQLKKANLPNLRYCFLRSCKIQKIERGAFLGGDNIVELDLSYNLINILDPIVFADLPEMKRLILHHNPIKELQEEPSIFPPLKISKLYLHSCQITAVQQNYFSNLKELDKIDLYSNKLASVDWRTFQGLERLKMLSLGENPWHCDCHFKSLFEFLENKRINFTYFGGIPTCATTTNMEGERRSLSLVGKTWNIRNEDNLCPPNMKHGRMLPFERTLASATEDRDTIDVTNNYDEEIMFDKTNLTATNSNSNESEWESGSMSNTTEAMMESGSANHEEGEKEGYASWNKNILFWVIIAVLSVVVIILACIAKRSFCSRIIRKGQMDTQANDGANPGNTIHEKRKMQPSVEVIRPHSMSYPENSYFISMEQTGHEFKIGDELPSANMLHTFMSEDN